MNSHQVGMVISDGRGRILDINEAFTNILGYTREECLSGAVNWGSLTPADQRHLSQRAIADIKRSGVHSPFEKEFFDKWGNRISVLVQTTYLKGSQDVYLGLIIDHKAQKQCEMNLPLLSERELMTQPDHEDHEDYKDHENCGVDAINEIMEQWSVSQMRKREKLVPLRTDELPLNHSNQLRLPLVPIGTCFFDEELRYININPVLASINGLSIEQHLGRKFHELLPTYAAQYEPLLRQVLNTGEPILNLRISGEIPGEPGSYGYWLGNYYPIQVAEGKVTGVGVTIMEIARFKQTDNPKLTAV
jgi:PAS domain S-box-containing protein